MKAIAIASGFALFGLCASTAQAQNFTYSSAANPATTVGGPDYRGNPVVGSFWTGTSTVTWADGKKTTEKYTCISTTQPVSDKVFDMHVVCDGSGADGTYSSIWGCQFTSKDRMSMACFGGMTGRTGKYAGKGGTMTFMGRGGSGSGTGTWAAPAS
jgi:hypothetical protein